MKGNFNKLINGNKPVLIDFHAEWCGPCKMQSPILKDVSRAIDQKVRIVKIDIDKNQSIAQRFNIKGVPTLALFKDGNMIWMQSGMQTKQQILNVIEQKVGQG